MSDLNDEIRKLKGESMSLRKIASFLGVSHEAVRKRLKNLEGKGKVSTIEIERKLTASTIQNERVSTAPNAHQSRASEEVMDIVNQVSTQKTPSVSLKETINPSGIASGMLSDSRKGIFQGVCAGDDDLLEAIKEFLESKGIEFYRMQVEPEAYQVSHNSQVIRFYVQRADGRVT